MHIQVRYFAVLRERVGCDAEPLELPDTATVASAVEALARAREPVRTLRGRFQTAVNQRMVAADTPLADGDELALIPPVAGGSGTSPRPRLARMVEEPPSLDRVTAAVAAPTTGAVVTFTGMVRRESRGRRVDRLEYEAYAEMADKVLGDICDEVEAELRGARVAVEHRSGVLGVGDVAVAIAAGAPHRAEAFAACRAVIERLKERAPIWKKEIGPDGAEWVGIGP